MQQMMEAIETHHYLHHSQQQNHNKDHVGTISGIEIRNQCDQMMDQKVVYLSKRSQSSCYLKSAVYPNSPIGQQIFWNTLLQKSPKLVTLFESVNSWFGDQIVLSFRLFNRTRETSLN